MSPKDRYRCLRSIQVMQGGDFPRFEVTHTWVNVSLGLFQPLDPIPGDDMCLVEVVRIRWRAEIFPQLGIRQKCVFDDGCRPRLGINLRIDNDDLSFDH
jgi:hypothetical protein